MMRTFIILSLLYTTVCQGLISKNSLNNLWKNFKDVHQKVYSAEEELVRRQNWERRLDDIVQHNLKMDLGYYSYSLGLNEFSDMSLEEVMEHLTGYNSQSSSSPQDEGDPWEKRNGEPLPNQLDWRDGGLVTPVKNQKPCGACWAFSTTGSLEGQHMKKTGKLLSLSEQNLVDCSTENDGCNGGEVNTAFQYVINNGGIDTEASYPYKATNGTCRFDKSSVGARCTGFVKVPEGDEEALKQAVALIGPVSVIIDACHNTFINYKSGVFDEPACRTDIPSHAVLVIGYGTEDGKDYWLVKNSWGTTWGMDGYIMMSRNTENQCGIASRASYPIV